MTKVETKWKLWPPVYFEYQYTSIPVAAVTHATPALMTAPLDIDAPSSRWYWASRHHILGELYRVIQSGIPWNLVAATWITSVPAALV